MATQYRAKRGKIRMLRVNDPRLEYGSGEDALHMEATVVLHSDPPNAFGFELIPGDKKLPWHLGMLSLLRDAYINDMDVVVGYWIEDGKPHGHLCLVSFE